jgi:hypothetical protein
VLADALQDRNLGFVVQQAIFGLSLTFFDTTSLYFDSEGGESIGKRVEKMTGRLGEPAWDTREFDDFSAPISN